MTTGRIDLHTHLLPGVDDGCKSYAESVRCARTLVENGYTHAVCSPHVWPSLPHNTVEAIRHKTDLLQGVLNDAKVPLTVKPGGELNLVSLWPALAATAREQVPTIGHAGQYVLFDFWADELPGELEPAVRWLREHDFTPILAHPERIGAFRSEPGRLDQVAEWGVQFQMNTWCLVEPMGSMTRLLAEEWLKRDRYFVFGTDLHNPGGMPARMAGLARATELVGAERVGQLAGTVPARLLSM